VENVDKIGPSLVIKELKQSADQTPLFKYFDSVWRQVQLTDEHWNVGIDLYAKYDRKGLLDYLRTCTGYSLEYVSISGFLHLIDSTHNHRLIKFASSAIMFWNRDFC
jgi:hypothetical protein